MHSGAKKFEEGVITQAKLKCACRKRVCSQCGRLLLTKVTLVIHQPGKGIQYTLHSFLPAPTTNICLVCGKTCCSAEGMKMHIKIMGKQLHHLRCYLISVISVKRSVKVSPVCSHPRVKERRMRQTNEEV